MNAHVPLHSEAAAEAMDTLLALYSARLDALTASWDARITASMSRPMTGGGDRQDPAALLAVMEHELLEVERYHAEYRKKAEVESLQAVQWEGQAMKAIASGRAELGYQAVKRMREHALSADAAAEEAAELEPTRDACRDAIAVLRDLLAAR